MVHDISTMLTYEVKKAIADRYFGFRKLIEDDKAELGRLIRQHSLTLEQKICFSLARIYILLKSPDLIGRFLVLSGMEEGFFFDPHIVESPTLRKKVFAGIKPRGLTLAGRFKNLLVDEYDQLVRYVNEHREKLAEFIENEEMIREEIKIFYQKNDIGNIMGFLRGLDGSHASDSVMVTPLQPGAAECLEEKMRISLPDSVAQFLPVIPPLVPLPQVRRQLKSLAEQAVARHDRNFLETL